MFIPHSEDDIKSLLSEIGLKSLEDLFAHIPQKVRKNAEIKIESLGDQKKVEEYFKQLALANEIPDPGKSFLGGGYYNHYIPAAIDEIIRRTEFYTAYTPYQPEISQGTLQALFEFQTMIADLFGMDIANASMYDGATSAAEAILMARRLEKSKERNVVLISSTLHPDYLEVIKTYISPSGIEIGTIPSRNGRVDTNFIEKGKNVFAVVVPYPNFFGILEDLEVISDLTHKIGAKLITVTTEPIALALFPPPGEFEVDIAVGEGQSLGIPLYFGGPGLGLFTSREEYVRQMPGRLVGETVDSRGNRGYVLTLSTREQHIRRERATSNICSNQGLNALIATIYLALMGKEGLRRVAEINYKLAHYFLEKLTDRGIEPLYQGEFFNEFTVKMEKEKINRLMEKGIVPGLHLGRFNPQWKDHYLITVTENNSLESIEKYLDLLGA